MIGVALSFILSSSISAAEGEAIVVYYVPFDVETYIPITEASISCRAWEKWKISDRSKVSRLLNIVKTGQKANFDRKRVRAEIIVAEQKYFIDAAGVVLNGVSSYKIDRYDFVVFGESSLDPNEREFTRDTHGPCD